ncbi:hypothetical protein [Prescottella equi]|uniref:hypothetical protein n=1 Tax=Rhodococcus hoagii TaxID=43767 RepID=UPI000A0F994C|nr:hypothetical protein [Prescottella equi]ORM18332.1 hypothetical protein A5N74_12055 [Prescottella equi]
MVEIDDLGDAGRRLYDALHDDTDPYSLTVLVVEAARIKDRLDKFNELLRGDADSWARLVDARGDDRVVEIRIDSVMQESRQQAGVLRQILGEIRRQKDVRAGGDDDDDLAGL